MDVKIKLVDLGDPKEEYQLVIGQGNFSVWTTDDLYKTILTCAPNIKCAVAMNEAKPRLTRVTGNDKELEKIASEACLKLGGGHIFVVALKGAFPINVLNAIKNHPGVCRVFAATGNPVQAIVAETSLGTAVLGIVDGTSATKIENEDEKLERRELVKKLGYVIQ